MLVNSHMFCSCESLSLKLLTFYHNFQHVVYMLDWLPKPFLIFYVLCIA